MRKIKTAILYELIVIFGIVIILFLVAGDYDLLERTYEFTREYESYEVDELLTMSILFVLLLGVFSFRRWRESLRSELLLTEQNKELQRAIEEIKQLRGIIPICMHCKKIRDDEGYWHRVEAYIERQTGAHFSHGICDDCFKEYYPDVDLEEDNVA